MLSQGKKFITKEQLRLFLVRYRRELQRGLGELGIAYVLAVQEVGHYLLHRRFGEHAFVAGVRDDDVRARLERFPDLFGLEWLGVVIKLAADEKRRDGGADRAAIFIAEVRAFGNSGNEE